MVTHKCVNASPPPNITLPTGGCLPDARSGCWEQENVKGEVPQRTNTIHFHSYVQSAEKEKRKKKNWSLETNL